MTLTTLVTVNGTLAAILACGIVWLLSFGVHSERRADALRHAAAERPGHEADRIAA